MKKTVLLTGGTGLLGQVLVRHFASKGWVVVTTARNQLRLKNLIESCASFKGTVIGVIADFSKPKAIARLMQDLLSKGVKITHLVNNARSRTSLSVQNDGSTLPEVFLNEFRMDVVVPYEVTINLSRSADHSLCAVVNVGSIYGEVAPNPTLYNGILDESPIQYGVSKAALHHLTRELAVRLSSKKIRVNCVAYGGVDGLVDDEFKARYAELVPSRKMLEAREVIGPIDFLLNEVSSSVNGHVLVADGGWSIW